MPEDRFAWAEDVILHRIRLNYEALADGLTGAGILQEILKDFGATPADEQCRLAADPQKAARMQKIQQFKFDRRPSVILKAWSGATPPGTPLHSTPQPGPVQP